MTITAEQLKAVKRASDSAWELTTLDAILSEYGDELQQSHLDECKKELADHIVVCMYTLSKL